jgi:hypothetical protein
MHSMDPVPLDSKFKPVLRSHYLPVVTYGRGINHVDPLLSSDSRDVDRWLLPRLSDNQKQFKSYY